MGKLFYIMGKSASGKDTIYQQLKEDEHLSLEPLVLYTTRPIREGELEGREYYFSSERRLKELREAGRIIEERVYQTVFGLWYYFTADEGQIHLEERNYIGIGTLESYVKISTYFGKERVVPIYIETSDGIRLRRAIEREEQQNVPGYEEMCRRFLADCRDFAEEKILEAGITRRFSNDGSLKECIRAVTEACEKEMNMVQ